MALECREKEFLLGVGDVLHAVDGIFDFRGSRSGGEGSETRRVLALSFLKFLIEPASLVALPPVFSRETIPVVVWLLPLILRSRVIVKGSLTEMKLSHALDCRAQAVPGRNTGVTQTSVGQ
jgi:hypothetical protein